MTRIPFVPFPLTKALSLSKRFLFLGAALSKFMPSLKLNLYQAEIPLLPREYISLAIFSSFFYFILVFSLTFFVGALAGSRDFLFSLFIGFIFSSFVYFYLLMYPKLVASRRVRSIERDVLTALQHMLIEVKSGVPLFNAMVGVSEGYGKVSEEFKKIVKEINAGVKENDALDEASQKNPSIHFRRALWQIANALRSGSDVAKALDAIVENLAADQVIAVRKYGQELNPYTMMYMLVAVILPTLGVTFLIILSSFTGLVIPKVMFLLILLAVALFQFFYMGLIKTKRPVMEV